MIRLLTLILLAGYAFFPRHGNAQISPTAEVQGYPAGVIGVAGIEWQLSTRARLTTAAGYNITRRQDFGKHDDERGDGPGLSADVFLFPGDDERGFFVGARTDLWYLDIDWRDGPDSPLGPERTGSTQITVLQPTARAGYRWAMGRGQVHLDATVSLGAEINIQTDGQDVGEGAIFLAGLRIGL